VDRRQGAVAKSDDPFIKLASAVDPAARAIRKRYEREVEAVVQKKHRVIAQARFARDGTSAYRMRHSRCGCRTRSRRLERTR